MIEAILVVTVVTASLMVMFGMLPWAARHGTTAMLLSLREDLYDLAIAHPQLRSMRQYRDAEYVLCLMIRIVRDQSAWTSLTYVFDVVSREEDDHVVARVARYAQDIEDAPELTEAAAEVDFLVRAGLGVMTLRAVFGSGPAVAISMVVIPILLLILLAPNIYRSLKEFRLVLRAPAVVVLAAALLLPFGIRTGAVSKAAGASPSMQAVG